MRSKLLIVVAAVIGVMVLGAAVFPAFFSPALHRQSDLIGRDAVQQSMPPGVAGKSFTATDNRTQSMVATEVERKVVTHSQMSVTVPKLEDAQKKVLEIVAALGGYVQSASFNSHPENQFWDFAVRIPSDKATEAVGQFGALGTVQSSSTNRQDVTEEFIDLEARLTVLRQEEARLLELLRRATTIDDFLKVEPHLSRVRVEIEQHTGRLKFLTHSVDLATISLRLTPELGTVEPEPVGFAGLGKRLRVAFRQGMNAVVEFISAVLVVATTALPLLIIAAPLAFLGLVLYRRHKK